MGSHVTEEDAAQHFPSLLNRVVDTGEEIIVERAGQAVCRISPIVPAPVRTLRDLVELLKSLPPLDEDYIRTVESVSRTQPQIPESPWDC